MWIGSHWTQGSLLISSLNYTMAYSMMFPHRKPAWVGTLLQPVVWWPDRKGTCGLCRWPHIQWQAIYPRSNLCAENVDDWRQNTSGLLQTWAGAFYMSACFSISMAVSKGSMKMNRVIWVRLENVQGWKNLLPGISSWLETALAWSSKNGFLSRMENVVSWITLQAGKAGWLEKSLGWK